MLQQLEELSTKTDGRYATDAELVFFQTYLKTARLRFSLYQKLRRLEPQLMKQLLGQLQQNHPELLTVGGQDMTAKWQRDTVLLLRRAAIALLTDDPDIYRDQILIWFQTIMQAFEAEKTCQETYKRLQTVVAQALSPEEAELICPLLEMSRTILGESLS